MGVFLLAFSWPILTGGASSQLGAFIYAFTVWLAAIVASFFLNRLHVAGGSHETTDESSR